MLRKTKLYTSLTLAFGSALALPAIAQIANTSPDQQPQALERVEITGSAIRRIQAEGALPITTLTVEDIQKTGAQSVTELLQQLPQLQSFVASANTVNNGGQGSTTAAIHSLPTKYTLVLLDGQRLAPIAVSNTFGGGFGVNLESIPLAAIERVEILTDGASALYGSDAIAGVVNFITRKNVTDGEASYTYYRPQEPGARAWRAEATKGFGNLDSDRFNVLLSVTHDEQTSLQASQRYFSANGGFFPFSYNGQNYFYNGRTSNTEPANLTFRARNAAGVTSAYALNPYYTQNGNCGSPLAAPITNPATLGATGVSCRFNFAATVQDIPAARRTSGLLKGAIKINDDTTLYSTFIVSDSQVIGQFAPSAQPFPVTPTTNSVLYNKYIAPYLAANGLTYVGSGQAGYRSVSLGGRTDNYDTGATHLSLGIKGTLAGWDYVLEGALSRSRLTDNAEGGYSDANQLFAAVAAGAYDPVAGTGQSAVSNAVLHQQFSKATSNLDSIRGNVQRDLFKLFASSPAVIAVGAEAEHQRYRISYSDLILSQSGFSTQPDSLDYPIGGSYGQVPFDASRTNYGAFAELLVPITNQLDVTLSGRYDRYDKVYSRDVFSSAVDPVSGLQNQIGNADLGNAASKFTKKLTVRFQPVQQLLLRGSWGTGFKAPNISDVAGALTYGGSTGGTYPCPFPGTAGCLPGSAQYDLLTGVNGLSGPNGLKPEESRQFTLGFRLEPVRGISVGADLWDVHLKNQVVSQGIPENTGFANPAQYAALFTNPYQDPAGFTTIAFAQLPFNGGEANYKGIDVDVSLLIPLPAANNVAVRWTGTHMLRQRYNFGPGQPFNTDLGVFGPDDQVVFRNIMNLSVSLQTGPFTNTFIGHYKSGYQDQAWPAGGNVFSNVGGQPGTSVAFGGLEVPSYTTVDWQGRYDFNKSASLSLGIKNLTNRNPPLSLQGSFAGNSAGYDARYADPIGREFYLAARVKF